MGDGKPWDETQTGRDREIAASFGAALKRERRRAHVTQAALAERSGLHPTTVSMIERGLRQPSLGVAFRLSRALGLPGIHLASIVSSEMEGRGG
jgi:transcriptional regulator with XRE-family HTH domain